MSCFQIYMILSFVLLFNYLKVAINSEVQDYAIRSCETKEKLIAITFDDGPHGLITPRILNILAANNAKATFFVMGVKVNLHPELLRRMYAEGHEVGNHGWSHPVMAKLSYERVEQELVRTSLAISAALNLTSVSYQPRVMRPPYGNTNAKLNKYILTQHGLEVILWSLDTVDWRRPPPSDIVKYVEEQVKAGDIVLCHDIHPGTMTAIETLAVRLKEKGFSLVTVSELLRSCHIHSASNGDSGRNSSGVGAAAVLKQQQS